MRATASVLLLLLAGCAAGNIKARSVEIVDDAGRTRMVLRSGVGPEIRLLDAEGRVRAGVILFPTGPLIALYDQHGEMRASMGLMELDEEEPRASWSNVGVFGPDGKQSIGLSIGLDGAPGIDVDGKHLPVK